MAATIMRNFPTVSTQNAGKFGLSTSFSKENSEHVDALTSFSHLTDVADTEDGVKYCQQLLSSCPRSQLAPVARLALSDLFYRAFECTNQVEYLNKAPGPTSIQRIH